MANIETSQRVDLLRSELKTWERNNSINGKKPTREIIKQNPIIANKYSEFQKLKDILSGKVCIETKVSTTTTKPRKRKYEEPKTSTPTKPRDHDNATPMPKSQSRMPYELDPYDSPDMIRRLFTPSATRFLGPTPQKDGIPLGVFDLLSEVESPITMASNNEPSHATPSKRITLSTEFNSTRKHTRTPNSSGKQYVLNAFLTPSDRFSKLQDVNTPVTVSKLDFGTPSFLRRGGTQHAMQSLKSAHSTGSMNPPSPEMTRLPRKALLMRGLSSIAADLRRAADEAAEEDLDILRELEKDAEPQSFTISSTRVGSLKKDSIPAAREEISIVEDSQPQLPGGLLGGFDDIGMFDSEPEIQNDRGRPLTIYKKRGQKRTTRRANLKPTRRKSGKGLKSTNKDTLSDSDSDSDVDTAHNQHEPQDLDTENIRDPTETIANALEGFKPDARNFDTDSSGSEYTASEGGTRYKRAKQKTKKVYDSDGNMKKSGRMRKVNTMAGQNFKRLKLRNNGAKGGPGVGSRYRRRK